MGADAAVRNMAAWLCLVALSLGAGASARAGAPHSISKLLEFLGGSLGR